MFVYKVTVCHIESIIANTYHVIAHTPAEAVVAAGKAHTKRTHRFFDVGDVASIVREHKIDGVSE